eukprot:JP446566.1.p1 GENE.JP446566.1~~JP446566.1.p1  ORF type:complete len:316 (-),score=156.01 JP446566.1:59-1006(-)
MGTTKISEMKVVAALALCVLALAVAQEDDSYYWFQYGKFVSEFRPNTDLGASMSRFEIFKDNLKYIDAHNAGNAAYTMGVNQFADMTYEEVFETMLTAKPENYTAMEEHVIPEGEVLANSVDWRSTLPAVKNQGQCGSCWAFSAVAAMEGRHGKVDLSEQQIVDCDSTDGGCNGGWYHSAWDYIKSAGGADSESSYPYKGKAGSCHFSKSSVKAQVSGHKSATGEAKLKSALQSGVVSVAVDASKAFMFYKSGVFTGSCTKRINHAITAVGYSGSDYYLVRNSWGTTWGDKGYIKMAMGEDLCGIADYAAYPTIA